MPRRRVPKGEARRLELGTAVVEKQREVRMFELSIKARLYSRLRGYESELIAMPANLLARHWEAIFADVEQ